MGAVRSAAKGRSGLGQDLAYGKAFALGTDASLSLVIRGTPIRALGRTHDAATAVRWLLNEG
jgi:hypothetical protein